MDLAINEIEKKLPVCDDLMDEQHGIQTHKYCAPIFIASIFSGTYFEKEEHLAPDKIDNNTTVRSGTVTFVSYKGDFFALTCKHVVEALERKQEKWKEEQKEKYNCEPPLDGFGFYTPIDNNQFHFNYKFTIIKQAESGQSADIAIARVKYSSISRLNRTPITLTAKKTYPETGIASGYPEEQRIIKEGEKISTFCPKFVTCIASLSETMNGNMYMEDKITAHNDVDVLSGMSGGPVIWSSDKRFGLVGIVKEGYDIQPKEGGLTLEDSILINVEKITPILLDNWLGQVPKQNELKDESKSLYIPKAMRK